jgi:predicted Zn-dependent protease
VRSPGLRLRGAAVVTWLLAAACARVPQVPPTPGWHELGDGEVVVDDLERSMWERSAQGLAPLRPLFVEDVALRGYVAGVLARITPAPLPAGAPRPLVHVVRAGERFAAALPNGVIVVTTSYLAALDNEAQLAALLGHELAHFLARHAFIEKRYAATSSSTVRRMRLSRAHEEAADELALVLVRRAGYDPRELLAMLALAQEDDMAGRTPFPEWEGHPYMADRLRTLEREVAGLDATGTVVGREAYEAAIADVLVVAAEAELEARHFDRARAIIDRHLRLRPESGRGYFLLAEHARLTAPEGHRSPAVRRNYERAVALAPRDPGAVRALALLYYETGDHTRARPLFETYLRIAPAAADRKLIERYLAESRR